MEWSPRHIGIIVVGVTLSFFIFVLFPYSLYRGAKENKRQTEFKEKNI